MSSEHNNCVPDLHDDEGQMVGVGLAQIKRDVQTPCRWAGPMRMIMSTSIDVEYLLQSPTPVAIAGAGAGSAA
jgi:hypothetical protein